MSSKAEAKQERPNRMSDVIGELAAALSKAQGEFETIAAGKTGQLGHRKYKYADFAATVTSVRPILVKHGLAVVQRPLETDGQVVKLETILTHSSGEWIASVLCIKSANDTAQGIGSALTYARRYGFSAMLGLVTEEDDDGKEAGKPQGPQPKRAIRVNLKTPIDTPTRGRIVRSCKDLEWTPDKLRDVIKAQLPGKEKLAELTLGEATGLADALEKKFLAQQGAATY